MSPSLFAASGSALAVLIASPTASTGDGHTPVYDIAFNEHMIAEWSRGRESLAEKPRDYMGLLVNPAAEPLGQVDYDDPFSVLSFVVTQSGNEGTVFPTERYYYYMFQLGHRTISGNIRFVDAHKEVIHIGYFDTDNPYDWRSQSWTSSDEVSINWDADTSSCSVSLGNASCVFKIDMSVRNHSPSTELAPEEEFVCCVRDESGYVFSLIYNNAAERFCYVLCDQFEHGDMLSEVPLELPSDRYRLLVGHRSRFAFLEDSHMQRRVLIGVSANEIRKNSFYDGPFDQVPPDLPLKDKLEETFPYVVERGGIDEHGNFLALEHQRVAISAYQDYELLGDFVSVVRDGLVLDDQGTASWISLAYDPKEVFHLRPRDQSRIDDLVRHDRRASLSWPANHWRQQSSAWPSDHQASPSRQATPNAEIR